MAYCTKETYRIEATPYTINHETGIRIVYTKTMMIEFVHSGLLIITIAVAFLFGASELGQFDLQIIAILFIILYLVKRFVLPKNTRSFLLESVVFTFIVTLIIATTGGSQSPYFFLFYFLLFSLALLLEPIISITTAVALIILLLFSLPQNQSLSSLIPVFSLAFLTPFALLLGEEFAKSRMEQIRADHLEEAYGRTSKETFLFLALVIKQHLHSIQNAIDRLNGHEQINTIQHSINRISHLVDKFERRLSQPPDHRV